MDAKRYRSAERQFWLHYQATPSEQWLELKEPATQVRIQEIGEGRPLLFIHGGPNAGSTWAPLASKLTNFRCILLDRPGCGLSPGLDYARDPLDVTMTHVLSSVLEALGLSQVDIVASSFGGACAFWLARSRPESVGRIVQLGVPAFLSQMNASLILRLLATPGIGALVARLPFNRSAVESTVKSMGHGKTIAERRLPDAYYEWSLALARDTDTMKNERELICRALTWRGMRPELVFADATLQALEHSIYFYWGADDPFATVQFGQSLVRGMKRAKIDVIPDSGHLPWLDDPQQTADRTTDFLTAL